MSHLAFCIAELAHHVSFRFGHVFDVDSAAGTAEELDTYLLIRLPDEEWGWVQELAIRQIVQRVEAAKTSMVRMVLEVFPHFPPVSIDVAPRFLRACVVQLAEGAGIPSLYLPPPLLQFLLHYVCLAYSVG